MSSDDIQNYANATTPPEVHVPNSWPALIVWAVGKFGVTFLFALAFGYAVVSVYEDGREREQAFERLNDRVLLAFRESTQANTEISSALREHTRTLDRVITRLGLPQYDETNQNRDR